MDQRKRVEEYEQAGCYHNNVNKQTNSRCDWGKKMQMWQSTVLCTSTLPQFTYFTCFTYSPTCLTDAGQRLAGRDPDQAADGLLVPAGNFVSKLVIE